MYEWLHDLLGFFKIQMECPQYTVLLLQIAHFSNCWSIVQLAALLYITITRV